ncbi:MAG: superoxide dismutase [Candidatus Parcubacteria bacterium]|nr:Fe-Mn family superoxide dismutase [Patescibacteria group bacterium]BCX16062.1 MAG: superoxide dismutase [Candidatus Parcubacteria bacterium]
MYQAQDFSSLLGLKGFSDQALSLHFSLYQGYVNNVNKILERLAFLRKENQADSLEFAELARRLGWEFNGMRLHEYYFSGLSKNPSSLNSDSALAKKIVQDFGSFQEWEKDFKSLSLMRGIGWVILYYDQKEERLINFWINEHQSGHPAGLKPLLNIDLFEHAYLIDYGTKKADYLQAFLEAVDWQVIEKRFSENS